MNRLYNFFLLTEGLTLFKVSYTAYGENQDNSTLTWVNHMLRKWAPAVWCENSLTKLLQALQEGKLLTDLHHIEKQLHVEYFCHKELQRLTFISLLHFQFFFNLMKTGNGQSKYCINSPNSRCLFNKNILLLNYFRLIKIV